MIAVALTDPKYPHNVAGAYRASAAWGASRLLVSGQRVARELPGMKRLPREERMRINQQEVTLDWTDRIFDETPGLVPVAVEVLESAVPLTYFQHPENALYVFGPEDGSVPSVMLRHCHQFVIIPSDHCLNLACAVNVVLADRRMKRQRDGIEPVFPSARTMFEERG